MAGVWYASHTGLSHASTPDGDVIRSSNRFPRLIVLTQPLRSFTSLPHRKQSFLPYRKSANRPMGKKRVLAMCRYLSISCSNPFSLWKEKNRRSFNQLLIGIIGLLPCPTLSCAKLFFPCAARDGKTSFDPAPFSQEVNNILSMGLVIVFHRRVPSLSMVTA